MKAVKEKLEDMKEMSKVKAEAKAEEKAEKELAKARVDVAHEVRLAKEAEAQMDMHVAKAERRVERELKKHGATQPLLGAENEANYAPNPNTTGHTTTTTTTPNTNEAGAPLRNNYI